MTTNAVATWDEIRAEMARHRVSTAVIATGLGLSYARFSTILNADAETNPKPEFAARIHEIIRTAAAEKKGRVS